VTFSPWTINPVTMDTPHMNTQKQVLVAFSLNVRSRREALGLSQEGLAERSELDRTYISGIERGLRNPTLLTAARLARALNTPLVNLFQGLME